MRNELARAEVLRLQRIESFRHDPLGFVEWAFPRGEGVLVSHEGPEAWQRTEKKEDMKKRGLASPDIGDALALTFAAPSTSFAWDLEVPVQEYCITKYDLYRDFKEDYWDEEDEFDE